MAVEPKDPPRRGVAHSDDLGQPSFTDQVVLAVGQRLAERRAAPVHVVAASAGCELRHSGCLARLGVQLEDQGAVVLVVPDQRVQRALRALSQGSRTIGSQPGELALDGGRQ